MRHPSNLCDLAGPSVAVVDARQAAALLGISRATLYRQLHEMPPRVQLSTRRFGWRAIDLAKWIEERRAAAEN